MLTRGVDRRKAWFMYQAVERFGPRWDEPKIDPKCKKPDGKFDYTKCTENMGKSSAPARRLEITKKSAAQFLKDVQTASAPEDIEILESKIKELDR